MANPLPSLSIAPLPTLGFWAATAIVVASMVGTGVFTSLGFQVAGMPSIFPLLLLWIVGGVVALCGALCYGELAAAMPRSGGEYHYLSVIYHPAIGFLSGWASATVGFAAPVALAALALGEYVQRIYPSASVRGLALIVVLVLALIHSRSVRLGGRVQVVLTTLKVGAVLLLIGAAFWSGTAVVLPATGTAPIPGDWALITGPSFAVSLVYVSYAYSGWNAAAYVTSEIRDPQRTLPRVLLVGTLLVAALYVGLNYAFLRVTPLAELNGQLEIGLLAAQRLFPAPLARLMALTIAALLTSTISAMTFAGPRIVQAIGEDVPALRFLAFRQPGSGVPLRALGFQTLLTLGFVVSGSFRQVMVYAGFILSLFTFLTVAGVLVLRQQRPELPRPYRTWGYPLTPLLFLLLNGWTLWFLIRQQPYESLAGLATLLVGLPLYYLLTRRATA
ncbi:MAG: amino acid permease [Hymenobacteraceae bacterium]|nr:amino acid permease [Hymenobacteraceae bacterium]